MKLDLARYWRSQEDAILGHCKDPGFGASIDRRAVARSWRSVAGGQLTSEQSQDLPLSPTVSRTSSMVSCMTTAKVTRLYIE